MQKEINIPAQTAEKIAQEIKSNLIPTLWDKMPQEEKEALLHRNVNAKQMAEEKILPKEKIPISFTEIAEKPPTTISATPEDKSAVILPKEPKPKIKKTITTETVEEAAPKPKRTKGPDKYREDI